MTLLARALAAATTEQLIRWHGAQRHRVAPLVQPLIRAELQRRAQVQPLRCAAVHLEVK